MPIEKQYIINRQGKDYALYSGVLNEAHCLGLVSIETTLVQIPNELNGHVAICTATVRLADKDGVARSFSGIGDAAPENVNKMMATALIRMAETRAKARALRDAINLAEALVDDPTEDEEAGEKAQRNGEQRGAIEELATQLERKTGKTVKRPDYATLTQGQANQWIDRLEQALQALAEAAPSR